ncbi:sensor histidine kinase [Vibrio sinaloensis]|uniref:sensor histidine kinase n=1 Tax=Photobacterium sp. (strain ATCC 43367) TaxID=379097 RepID=UPI0020628F05|nr:ATP-binding protein [Vibrio sinaloensis]UPQ89122.1 ATP-binding protein [Vibrio sinaloensis]
MRRIYIESFLGLLLLFILTLSAYEVVIYRLSTDYDFVLEDREGEALNRLWLTIHATHGEQETLKVIQDYVDRTASTMEPFSIDQLPPPVLAAFSSPDKQTFFDSDRAFWFRLENRDVYYRISPDESSSLRKAITFDDNIFWLFLLGGFSIYSLGLIWFLSRRARKLEDATLRFAQGDFTVRASTASRHRVGSLNQSFNYMADKISNLVTSNRFLTNAVAHDLRTPIFRIQWQAEMLRDEPLTDAQQDKLASIIEDTEEMEQMVEDLLYFAKVERPTTQIEAEIIYFEPLCQHLIERCPESEKNIELNCTPDLAFSADKALLKRALANLLSNAVRYASTHVVVSAYQNQQQVVISFDDDGIGVDPKHWPTIFDPFYSADSARNKQSSGFGLGLAIVKMIVARHKGEVSVGNSELGGAKFTLVIPLDESKTK